MSNGKNICETLKALRSSIAKENDIPFETTECKYKGECSGTCPSCEAEREYIEEQLAKRISLGKIATVAGLTLGLATGVQAQNTNSQPLPTATTPTAPPLMVRSRSVPDTTVKKIEHTFSIIPAEDLLKAKGYTLYKHNEVQYGILRGEESNNHVIIDGFPKRRMVSPWDKINDKEKNLVGAIGVDIEHGNVATERKGTMLIVVPKEEPSLSE